MFNVAPSVYCNDNFPRDNFPIMSKSQRSASSQFQSHCSSPLPPSPSQPQRPAPPLRPNLTFGKLPLRKLLIWEVAIWKIVTWEVALGKMSLGKYLTLSHTYCISTQSYSPVWLPSRSSTFYATNAAMYNAVHSTQCTTFSSLGRNFFLLILWFLDF